MAAYSDVAVAILRSTPIVHISVRPIEQRPSPSKSQHAARTQSLGLRIATVALLSVLMVLLAAKPLYGQSSSPEREYEVKAAFLYRFAQFVEWPETTADRITLCLLGEDPFGSAMDKLDGKEVGDRTLVVRRLTDAGDAGECQVLFISSSAKPHLADMIGVLDGHRVLTVGETDRFTQQGGIIKFYKVRNRLRFEVNLEAARKAGVEISSRMLKLARIV